MPNDKLYVLAEKKFLLDKQKTRELINKCNELSSEFSMNRAFKEFWRFIENKPKNEALFLMFLFGIVYKDSLNIKIYDELDEIDYLIGTTD